MQWYLTRYARLLNGEVELLTYAPMSSLAEAQYKSKTQLPNNEFYEVECKVGSLLPPKPQPCWIARDCYSHKPAVAQFKPKPNSKHSAYSILLIQMTLTLKMFYLKCS